MAPTFVLTELLAYGVGVLFLIHAVRKKHLGLLLAATAYGFLLEYHTVRTETAYCYGQFMVMLPPWPAPPEPWCAAGARVPLWGSVVWGYFIYSAMQTSSRISMPWQVRALFDGLLVLTFDLVLDPVAVKEVFWTWTAGGPWFGVPLDNFFGWFMVATSFSFMYRAITRKWPLGRHGIAGEIGLLSLIIVVAILLLAGSLEIYVHLAAWGIPDTLLLSSVLLAAAAVVMPPLVRARGTGPLDVMLVGLVALHHLYNGGLMVYSGLLAEQPLLGVVWVAAITLAMIGYAWPAYGRAATR